MPLDPKNWGVVGGDDEPPLLLKTLALRWPQYEFVLVGRNSGEDPADVGLPPNVTNPWTELQKTIRSEFKDRKIKTPLDPDVKPEVIKIFDKYTLDLFRDLDHLIVWTGQHGTSNTPIPKVGAGWDDITNPQDAFVFYASYIIRGINLFRASDPINKEEIWLCPDPRNYIKCRDLKWPPRHPVLGQFDFVRQDKHERYTDTRYPETLDFNAKVDDTGHVWVADHKYIYSQLEICGILPEHVDSWFFNDWDNRLHFGIFVNEARAYVTHNRLDAVLDYVMPLSPYFIHGKWSDKSLEQIKEQFGYSVNSAPAEEYYDKLRSVRSTLTTPSSGSGWATTKPWQSFATGTVCFFHPEYDTQGHIIPLHESSMPAFSGPEELGSFLRIRSPAELKQRVELINTSKDAWEHYAGLQRDLYDSACKERRVFTLIEERIHG